MSTVQASAPRVSVVVPAYNNAAFIAATLDSILAQDYGDFELVIADHSSTDGTQAVIDRYASDPRVRILPPTPAGGGAPANWSRVSAHARGEFIKLVCGDDLLAPQALRLQVAAFDALPGVTAVACQRDLIDAAGRVIMRGRGLAGLQGVVEGRQAVRASVLAGTNIFGEPGCVLMRRDVFERQGGWDGRFPYLIDQASYTRVMLQGRVVAVRQTLASFRISATQWSVKLTRQQAEQAIGFHRELHRQHPGLLTSFELAVGNGRAWAMAHTRRLAYAWLKRRM